jgi:hypothetical protein
VIVRRPADGLGRFRVVDLRTPEGALRITARNALRRVSHRANISVVLKSLRTTGRSALSTKDFPRVDRTEMDQILGRIPLSEAPRPK